MKNIKVNIRYKAYYALGIFSIYLIFLLVYGLVKKSSAELLLNVLGWGIPCLFIYYVFIHRIKILITDDNRQLICKPSNSIWYETIDLQKIHSIRLKKGIFFDKIVIRFNMDKVVLYPENSLSLLNLFKSICKNAKISKIGRAHV